MCVCVTPPARMPSVFAQRVCVVQTHHAGRQGGETQQLLVLLEGEKLQRQVRQNATGHDLLQLAQGCKRAAETGCKHSGNKLSQAAEWNSAPGSGF